MRITFHGATQTVTGSQHLLEVNGARLLLDCGLFQGKRALAFERNRNLPYEASQLRAVLLSHAHIDHSGNLPNLLKKGYKGRIYATRATAHLTNLMLLDSAHVQEADVEYLNRKHAKKGEAPLEPLYTLSEAAQVGPHFEGVDYDQPFEVADGVVARFVDAGHILGSAAVVLDIEEARPFRRRKFRLWFSGDIGRRDLPLLRDPILPQAADWMIMECTYGDKAHDDPQQAVEELRQAVLRTVERRGKVIIPAFAVGRTQELLYHLQTLIEAGCLPRIPVFVDSPLAIDASEIYRSHPECFDQETLELLHQGRHRTILGFGLVTYTRSVEESKALNERREPMIIISASGMAEHGRILHHLKNNIEDPRNTILIVSWQAPDTLGRRLADRETKVRIFGETYTRRAEVVTIGGFSAHAGQNFLVEYAQNTLASLKGLALVHGEPHAAQSLQERLFQAGIEKILYPSLHDSWEI